MDTFYLMTKVDKHRSILVDIQRARVPSHVYGDGTDFLLEISSLAFCSIRSFSTVSESWPERYRDNTESTECRLQAISVRLLLMVQNLTTSKKKINNNSIFQYDIFLFYTYMFYI